MSDLRSYLNLTTDGSLFIGMLDGFDTHTNILLRHAHERILAPLDTAKYGFSRDLGTFIIRGDMIVAVGLVDGELDSQIDWPRVRGERLGTTRHKG